MNLAAAADAVSGTLHNIGACVDRDAARDSFNRSHRAFVHCKCEIRRQKPDGARQALRTMLSNLDTLSDLARRADRRPEAIRVCGRVVENLRAGVAGLE